MTRLVVLCCALLTGACTSGPDYHKPAVFTPPSWSAHNAVAPGTTAGKVDARWWRALGDTELSALEDRLAASNLDVATATSRVAEVRAARTVAGAAGKPALDAGAGYGRDRISRDGPLRLLPDAVTRRARRPFDLFDAGFDAAWELDLWGRVRRGVEAADAALAASEDERRAVLVTAEAELARSYIALRRAQLLLVATQQFVDAAGRTGQGALSRAETALVEARLPLVRAEIAALENAVALLVGAPPGVLEAELGTSRTVPPVPPAVPVGVPSELVERRPDVRAAEARLHETTAGIGMAEADFFPRITLSGSVGVQALQPKYLGSLGAVGFSAGPGITVPLFEGGRLRGQLELRRAEQQEAAVAFQAATLGAFHDVANALDAYAAEGERRAVLLRAVADARQAVERRGAGAQRVLLEAETELVDSTASLATDYVQLCKALGGGWEAEFPDRPAGR